MKQPQLTDKQWSRIEQAVSAQCVMSAHLANKSDKSDIIEHNERVYDECQELLAVIGDYLHERQVKSIIGNSLRDSTLRDFFKRRGNHG